MWSSPSRPRRSRSRGSTRTPRPGRRSRWSRPRGRACSPPPWTPARPPAAAPGCGCRSTPAASTSSTATPARSSAPAPSRWRPPGECGRRHPGRAGDAGPADRPGRPGGQPGRDGRGPRPGRGAGAAGITCAKLGEAEVMADAGLDDLLIAFPLVGEAKLGRLAALLERARVRVSLDSVEVAEGLGRVGARRGRDVEVLVEVDTGLHRLGRPPGAPTAELVGHLARVPGVEVAGLLTHAGHSYRAGTPE